MDKVSGSNNFSINFTHILSSNTHFSSASIQRKSYLLGAFSLMVSRFTYMLKLIFMPAILYMHILDNVYYTLKPYYYHFILIYQFYGCCLSIWRGILFEIRKREKKLYWYKFDLIFLTIPTYKIEKEKKTENFLFIHLAWHSFIRCFIISCKN